MPSGLCCGCTIDRDVVYFVNPRTSQNPQKGVIGHCSGGVFLRITRVTSTAGGYYAIMERTGEETFVADFQFDKVLG